MGDLDLTASLSGAALAAMYAQSLTRPPTVHNTSPIADEASAAVGGVTSTLARPTQLTDAVQAAEMARMGSKGSNTLNANRESQDVAQARQEVNTSLGAMAKDVHKFVKALGIDSTAAREVEKKLSVALSDKVSALTESPSALRAAAGGSEKLVLGASHIEIAVNNRSGAVSARVDDVALSSLTNFLNSSQSSYDQYGASGYGSSPSIVGSDGRPANLNTAPAGVYFDVKGDSGKEFASLLASSSTPGATSSGSASRPHPDDHASQASPQVQARSADTLLASGGDRTGVGSSGSGLPSPVDTNQDGLSDQQDGGYQSILIMRSGGGMSPLAEGGVTRVQFDAAIQLAFRVDSSGLVASVESHRKDGPVTPTAKAGLDFMA